MSKNFFQSISGSPFKEEEEKVCLTLGEVKEGWERRQPVTESDMEKMDNKLTWAPGIK